MMPVSPKSPDASLPDATKLLLLAACLSDGDAALSAWQRWQEKVKLAGLALDRDSTRLLPLLYHNLQRLGVEKTRLASYLNFRQRAWMENQALARRVAETLATLAGAGIPSVVLKGIALAQLYYPTAGLRPMADGDLLVPFDQAVPAMDLLLRIGWVTNPPIAREDLIRYNLTKRHGWGFCDRQNRSIDLHWRVLNISASAARDTAFWEHSEPFILHGTATRTLSSAHHLLHVCLHGVLQGRDPSLRWIADAVLILRSPSGVDWPQLIETAQNQQVAHILSHALHYLQRHFAAPVPASVFARLDQNPIPPWAAAEFAALTSGHEALRRRYYLWHRFNRLRATSPEWARPAWVPAYLEFLRLHWEVPSMWQLPGHALRKLTQKNGAS